MRRFFRENGLSLTLFGVFFLILLGQFFTGHDDYNQSQGEHNQPTVGYGEYLVSGHFLESVGENWESEFLQMGMFILLTIWLRQKGALASKSTEGKSDVDAEPDPNKKDAPWPVRRGGWILKLYQHSLSIALFTLFIFSFALHAYGGAKEYCHEQQEHGEQCLSTLQFIGTSHFWFQSFQNWQSEFLSIGVLVVFSIYLRQKGSPESKPVDAPHHQTGEE